MSYSDQLLSIHLSGNQFNSYEKLYIRYLLKARVVDPYKNHAHKQAMQNLTELHQFQSLSDKGFQSKEIERFLETMNFVEKSKND